MKRKHHGEVSNMVQNVQRLLSYKIILIALMIASSINSYNLTLEDERFLQNHMLPQGPAKQELDRIFKLSKDPELAFRIAGCTFLKSVSRLIVVNPRTPNYIYKTINYHEQYFQDQLVGIINRNRNINRIVVNDKIQQCISLYNLRHIVVPKKYLYHIPGKPLFLDDANYIVVADRLDTFCKSCNNHEMALHLTPEQEKEVYIVIRFVGYGDAKPDNIMFLKNGKIAFIDTEPIYGVDFLENVPGFARLIKFVASIQGKNKFKQLREQLRKAYLKQKKDTFEANRTFDLKLLTECNDAISSCDGI